MPLNAVLLLGRMNEKVDRQKKTCPDDLMMMGKEKKVPFQYQSYHVINPRVIKIVISCPLSSNETWIVGGQTITMNLVKK